MSKHNRFRFEGAIPELLAKTLLRRPPSGWGSIPQCQPAAEAEAQADLLPAKSARTRNWDSDSSRQPNLREQNS